MAEELSASSSLLPTLHAALSRASSPMLRRTGTGIVVGWTVGRAVHSLYGRARSRLQYQVRVSSDDAIYRRVSTWVVDLIPESRGRSLRVETRRDSGYGDVPEPDDTNPGFTLLYDGNRSQAVDIDGHRVVLSIEREKLDGSGGRRSMFSYELVFTAATLAGRDAVVEHLRRLHTEEQKSPPVLRVLEKWGDWRRMTDVPVRALESVILPGHEREDIEEDLARFLGSEAEYARWGSPWHRGYLFSGPPGTGKTSMATALAFAFGLDAYYLSLSGLDEDSTLLRALLGVGPRSVLIIEDIDVVHASRSRDDTGGGVTLAGLLNALDGMVTPHGLVTIMTTNRREVLDDALVRPGRVDYEWASKPLTDEQAARIGAYFGHQVYHEHWIGRHASDLVGYLKTLEHR